MVRVEVVVLAAQVLPQSQRPECEQALILATAAPAVRNLRFLLPPIQKTPQVKIQNLAFWRWCRVINEVRGLYIKCASVYSVITTPKII